MNDQALMEKSREQFLIQRIRAAERSHFHERIQPYERRERRRTILESVRRAVLSVTSLPLGYAYRFEPTSEVLAQLAHLVDFERQCCAFLTFRIGVEAANQGICLEVTGPAGSQRAYRRAFRLVIVKLPTADNRNHSCNASTHLSCERRSKRP